jgi:uncharacterized repeat protein (TIGR03803 family)
MRGKIMQKRNRSVLCVLNFAMTALMVLLCASFAWAGAGERTLYAFTGGSNAAVPYGTMIFDSTGSLYGLAGGGANNDGAVFKFTRSGTGSWTESVIYSFNAAIYPSGYLVFDASGNLYGTTQLGGSSECGNVYQLVPGSDGSWTENTIYSFMCQADGYDPMSVVFDAATGNLYGLAAGGGEYNLGTLFELVPVVGGGWNFNLIYSFGDHYDGGAPQGSLTLDSSGNFYGTTVSGGSYGSGTVFKFTAGTSGWAETVLYNFTGGDNGAFPFAGVIFDRQGNLYGTTNQGGDDDVGVIYQLTPTKGEWAIHVIHRFTGGPDGGYPSDFNLAIDGARNLYGTTLFGGLYGDGTAYKLSPSLHDIWNESVLHAFTDGADGGNPESGLVLGSSGSLFGTTQFGGADGDGVVFQIKP